MEKHHRNQFVPPVADVLVLSVAEGQDLALRRHIVEEKITELPEERLLPEVVSSRRVERLDGSDEAIVVGKGVADALGPAPVLASPVGVDRQQCPHGVIQPISRAGFFGQGDGKLD